MLVFSLIDSVALCFAVCVDELIALIRPKDIGLGMVNLHPQLHKETIEIVALRLS